MDDIPIVLDQASRRDLARNLRNAFLRALVLPVLVVGFFALAPFWLNHRLRSAIEEGIDQGQITNLARKELNDMDLAEICRSDTPEYRRIKAILDSEGISFHFQRLEWGLNLSVALIVILGAGCAAILFFVRLGSKSRSDLVWYYRLGWWAAISAALVKAILLVPLLGFGLFELTTLAADQFFPKLILLVMAGGLYAVWQAGGALVRPVPLEFAEVLAREVDRQEAPALWVVVEDAARQLKTEPPDHIVMGMSMGFYVTEMGVVHDTGRCDGRTLYLSYPLLHQLCCEEVKAVIGHELAHFIGEDTRFTREFYPIRFKFEATMQALAESPLVTWSSLNLLSFFNWCFEVPHQAVSRERELRADLFGATLTTSAIMAAALAKTHVFPEALRFLPAEEQDSGTAKPFETPLAPLVREHLGTNQPFWTALLLKKTPHPLDSHPPLKTRLASLGLGTEPATLRELATTEGQPSAFAAWFGSGTMVFAEIDQRVRAIRGESRTAHRVAVADVQTCEGKALLESHFPEIVWPVNPEAVRNYACLTCVGVALLTGLGVYLWSEHAPWCALVFPLTGLIGYVGFLTVKRAWKGQFVLRADSLTYTGWKRPLLFSSVERISSVATSSNHTFFFHLKKSENAYENHLPWKRSTKAVALDLHLIKGFEQDTMETLKRYFNRET